MDKEITAVLSKGLLEGYVGKTVRGSTVRSGFPLETSDYKGSEGTYHDEWAADFNGGGQELVESPDGKKGTRVYAGGTLSAEKLQQMGLTKKDVIGKLIYFVNELKDGTRLSVDAELTQDDWKYSYKVLRKVEEIPLDLGQEEIRYKDSLVFIHFHIISPVI